MRRFRITIRTLMIAVVFVAANAALVVSMKVQGVSLLTILLGLLGLNLLTWSAFLGFMHVWNSGGILRLVWKDVLDYRINIRPKRMSTRTLMIITAVVGVDAAMVVQASRMGPGIAFTLFIAAVMGTLNLFFATYLESANRINAAPPEKQTEMILSLGCLLMVIMALLIPVTIMVLWKASG